VLHFQMDQYPEAEVALRQATTTNPDYVRAWENLASAFGAQGKLEDAAEACQRALELRPDSTEAHFKIGIIYFTQNDFDRAANHFAIASRQPALAAYCYSFQAIIHSKLEQAEAAEAALLRAMELDPKCDLLWVAWNELGRVWFVAGDHSRAASAYGEATIIKPDEPEAWFNLGAVFYHLGDLEASRGAYQQAADLEIVRRAPHKSTDRSETILAGHTGSVLA
jgi:tetratricopeptide (TPR) repeat protein